MEVASTVFRVISMGMVVTGLQEFNGRTMSEALMGPVIRKRVCIVTVSGWFCLKVRALLPRVKDAASLPVISSTTCSAHAEVSTMLTVRVVSLMQPRGKSNASGEMNTDGATILSPETKLTFPRLFPLPL
jgi:hypothetical protein